MDRLEDLPPAAGYIVATPAATHAAVVTALLPRGVPIFCEKPLTIDGSAARWLAEHAADRLFVMDKWRYHTGVRELGRIARSGELGPVVGLKTQRLGWSLPQADVDCAWTLLPHELTIALEILGHVPRPRQACAEHAADGTLLGLSGWLGDAVWQRTEVGIHGPRRPRRVELQGAAGSVVLPDADSDHVLLIRPPADRSNSGEPLLERRPIAVEQPLLSELQTFLSHLRGGPAPRSSAQEAVVVVETIEALRRLANLSAQPAPYPFAA